MTAAAAKLAARRCPFGPAVAWRAEAAAVADIHTGTVCAITGRAIPKGTAHTHFPQDMPEQAERPLICLPPRDLEDRSCECGRSPLFWHELAHALVGRYAHHGERWQLVRAQLEHDAFLDVWAHVEPWDRDRSVAAMRP